MRALARGYQTFQRNSSHIYLESKFFVNVEIIVADMAHFLTLVHRTSPVCSPGSHADVRLHNTCSMGYMEWVSPNVMMLTVLSTQQTALWGRWGWGWGITYHPH